MSYVTATAMQKKFGERELIQLTDNELDEHGKYADAINVTKLQAALDTANSEIDSYLISRYSLPLKVIPPFLTSLGCDIAFYHASVAATRETERTIERYHIATKILTNISKGVIALGSAPAGESAPLATSQNNVMFGSSRPSHFGNGGW